MVHTGHKATGSSVAFSVGIGAVAGMVVGILLLLLLTSLVMNGSVGEENTAPYIIIVRTIGGFAGCMLATVIARKKHLTVIALTGVVDLLLLLAIGIAFYDGSFTHFGSGLISVVIGCGAACMIWLKPPSKKKYKHRRGR